jgi:hypothetical protein
VPPYKFLHFGRGCSGAATTSGSSWERVFHAAPADLYAGFRIAGCRRPRETTMIDPDQDGLSARL